MKDKSAFLGHGYRVLANNQNHRTKENQQSRTSQTSPEAVLVMLNYTVFPAGTIPAIPFAFGLAGSIATSFSDYIDKPDSVK